MKYIGLFDEKEDIVTKEKLDAVKSTIPTKTSQLDNDSGFITSAPVTSVNTKTGAVTLSASDVGAQPTITVNGIIKGDGTGGVSAAEAGTDYAPAVMFVEVTGSSGDYETNVYTQEIWMVGRGKRSVFMYGDEDSMFYPLIASTQQQAYFGGLDAYGNAVRYIVNSNRTVEKHLTPIGGKTYPVILTVAGWNASTKQQVVSFVAASSTETDHLLIPTPKLSDLTAYNNAGILCIGEDGTAQTLTFQCETVPTEDITIYVTIQSVNYQEVSV